jgi:transposase
MSKQAKSALGISELNVIANRVYFSSKEIRKCEEAGSRAFAPKCVTSGAKADGRFGKADFIYDAETNEYRCPAGQRMIWRFAWVENGLKLSRYWSSHCPQCPIKSQCTPSDYRRVSRWEHEEILDAMQARLDLAPDSMRLRRQTVEHPFGTLKTGMGATHFLTKTLKNVSTDISLQVLAYNMKRVMNLRGTAALMEAMMS